MSVVERIYYRFSDLVYVRGYVVNKLKTTEEGKKDKDLTKMKVHVDPQHRQTNKNRNERVGQNGEIIGKEKRHFT